MKRVCCALVASLFASLPALAAHDLEVVDLQIDQVSGYPGDLVDVDAVVMNYGPDSLSDVWLGVYLSSDSDIELSDSLVCETTLGPMPAGSVELASLSCAIPSVANASYYLGGYAASMDKTSQIDASGTQTGLADDLFTVLQAQVDLATTEAVLLTPVASPGDTVNFGHTTANLASGDAPLSFSTAYLSTDSVITSTDKVLCGVMVGALSAGSSVDNTSGCILPSLDPGTYHLGVVADIPDVIVETDETNNGAVAPTTLVVSGPDLTVSSVSVANQYVEEGDPISVTVTAGNIGSKPTSQTDLAIYLSLDWFLDSGDVELCRPNWFNTLGELDPGEFETLNLNCALPEDVAGGVYSILATVDPDGVLAEVSESNNTAASQTEITVQDLGFDVDIEADPTPHGEWGFQADDGIAVWRGMDLDFTGEQAISVDAAWGRLRGDQATAANHSIDVELAAEGGIVNAPHGWWNYYTAVAFDSDTLKRMRLSAQFSADEATYHQLPSLQLADEPLFRDWLGDDRYRYYAVLRGLNFDAHPRMGAEDFEVHVWTDNAGHQPDSSGYLHPRALTDWNGPVQHNSYDGMIYYDIIGVDTTVWDVSWFDADDGFSYSNAADEFIASASPTSRFGDVPKERAFVALKGWGHDSDLEDVLDQYTVSWFEMDRLHGRASLIDNGGSLSLELRGSVVGYTDPLPVATERVELPPNQLRGYVFTCAYDTVCSTVTGVIGTNQADYEEMDTTVRVPITSYW